MELPAVMLRKIVDRPILVRQGEVKRRFFAYPQNLWLTGQRRSDGRVTGRRRPSIVSVARGGLTLGSLRETTPEDQGQSHRSSNATGQRYARAHSRGCFAAIDELANHEINIRRAATAVKGTWGISTRQNIW
jgi:hypothetical protein